jgi:hypothetical protein
MKLIEMLIFGRRLKTIGGCARVSIPQPGIFPPLYVFEPHKSGSALMNNMLVEAFDQVKIPHLALSELSFAAGLPEDKITNPEKFIFSHSYCYRGFRAFPHYLKAFDILKPRPKFARHIAPTIAGISTARHLENRTAELVLTWHRDAARLVRSR